jgi:hypothetical protein
VSRARLRLLLLVGGAALTVLIAVAVAVAVVFVGALGAPRSPTQTVNEFIRSVEVGDCALYVAVTTEAFRDGMSAADDCAASGVFDGSGTIDYRLDISGERVTGSTAAVAATLSIINTSTPEVKPTTTPITFDLVQESGVWKVDASY